MKKLLLAPVLILAMSTVIAQKSIRELSELKDKKFEKLLDKADFRSEIPRFVKNYEKQTNQTLGSVKLDFERVGILTFFTADHSVIDYKAKKRGGVYESYLSEAGGKTIVDPFYAEALPEMKRAFQKHGISLEVPSEYVTDRDVYENYEVEVSKLVSGLLKAGNYLTGQKEKSLVAADGYRVFPTTTLVSGSDMKVMRSMGTLCEKLGVDALLSVQILTSKEKSDIGLKAVRIALHCPNPVPDHPDINYGLGFYYEGILAGYVGMEFDDSLVFAELPRKARQIKNMETEGFAVVIQRMVSDLLQSIVEDNQ